jgi:hypothetical protein
MRISSPAFEFLSISFFKRILKTSVSKLFNTTKECNLPLTAEATSHFAKFMGLTGATLRKDDHPRHFKEVRPAQPI